MVLETQKFLRSDKNTLSDLLKDPFNLSVSRSENPDLDGLVGLKYNAPGSDLSNPICQECRGLILDSGDNWNVVSFPFKKFFNMGNSQDAHDIDWDTATLFEKMDGSCTILYHYAGKWHVQTLGVIDATGNVRPPPITYSKWSGSTFQDLFWYAWDHCVDVELSDLNTEINYIFELCTPYNKRVVDYGEDPQLTLIGARNVRTLNEYDVREFEGIFQIPFQIDASELKSYSEKAIRDMIDVRLNALDEGFVVCDDDFNRVKVKSEDYVKAHGKGSDIRNRKYGMLEQLLLGNRDDIVTIYPEYEKAFQELEDKIAQIANHLEKAFRKFGGYDLDAKDPEERKTFALKAKEFRPGSWVGYLFQRFNDPSTGFVEIIKNDNYRKVGDILAKMD